MIKRWNGQYQMYSSKEKADQSFKVLKMLELGADISQKDSHRGTLLQTILIETKGSSTILLLENKRNER